MYILKPNCNRKLADMIMDVPDQLLSLIQPGKWLTILVLADDDQALAAEPRF
jgi:hypothetical protein